MNTKLLLLTVCILLACPSLSFGQDFHVNDPASFQAALTNAESNGQDDTIYVAAGTYNLTSMLHYGANDGDGSLTIVAEDPNNRPVLDGQHNVIILNIDNDFNGDSIGDEGDTIVLRYIIFQNGLNSSTHGYGGGLSIRIGAADVEIDHCLFQNNFAFHDGGGAWINSGQGSGSLSVTNSQFISNQANEHGGGFYFFSMNGSLTVTGNRFVSNSVSTSSNNTGGGGFGAFPINGSVTVSDNMFQNNSAGYNGGGARFGTLGTQPMMIARNTFSGNSAGNKGGGLSTGFRRGSNTITVVNNIFSNNQATDDGGGLYVGLLADRSGNPSTGTANITNNVFVGNSADDNGGGFKLTSISGTLNVTNNTAYGNRATRNGGGLQAKLINNDATLNIYNNIIFANTSGNGGDDIYVNSDAENDQGDGIGSPVALFNNDIGPNNNNFSGSSEDLVISDTDNYTHGNNIDTDPQLRSPSSGDVHLLTTSPCIDTGTNSAPAIPSIDIDNQPRITDGNNDGNAVVDMGADEAGAQVATVPTMNQWGFIALSLLFGIASLYVLKMNKFNI